MNYSLTTRQAFVFIMLFLAGSGQLFAGNFQSFNNAKLASVVDGDSFLVDIGDSVIHLRLYFVDCPESAAGSKSDVLRIQEQQRYFGLINTQDIIHFGKLATNFTHQALSRPFTVHTAFANALGRSSSRRVYGLVETDKGDLGHLLISSGLCRSHGVGRKTPNGVSRKAMFKQLRALESVAMLKRIGVWAKSDTNEIVRLRDIQHQENLAFKKIQQTLKKHSLDLGKIDLNSASVQQLKLIKGIGTVLARRIIRGRPYQVIDDLLKVRGIGKKNMRKISPYLFIDN
ncbi:hypothetical protein MNB_SUP05-SYMBIONT-7-641 [hydrothermal vent metagenome]|uniref:TNase-like domain-containing protein n=1 Tax=hydrothermal vent metagenome TaxID=652676 RepID=A0A1W1E3M5_9ZZZZ